LRGIGKFFFPDVGREVILRKHCRKERVLTPFSLRFSDYLELVDWTGRQLREGKRGSISEGLPPILDRLQIDPKRWL